jgi:hypothetical protein
MLEQPEYTPPLKHGVFVLKTDDGKWAVMESWIGDGNYRYKFVAEFDTEEEANGVLKLLKE